MYLDTFTSVKSRDLNYKQFQRTILICGLELNDIQIQQDFNNLIRKEPNYYTGKEMNIYSKEFYCEHSGQSLTL